MNRLFLLISVSQFLLSNILAQTSQQDARLGGKVYVTYRNPGASTLGKKYISNFKVILIKKTSSTVVSTITANKKNFCSNDRTLFQRYGAKVAYTNADGYFEFRGLMKQTNYILIFCDRDIKLSEVSTGNRNTTYGIGEKIIKL
jgi:hypothetical protein